MMRYIYSSNVDEKTFLTTLFFSLSILWPFNTWCSQKSRTFLNKPSTKLQVCLRMFDHLMGSRRERVNVDKLGKYYQSKAVEITLIHKLRGKLMSTLVWNILNNKKISFAKWVNAQGAFSMKWPGDILR